MSQKKVRFGIIGTNFITDWVLQGAALEPRFEFTALYSRTKERGEEYAARYGVAHVFTDLEEMVSSGLIDAVYIASPNSCHASQAIMCMKHGKHVLSEKAFASDAGEARQMIETAKKYKVTLMEAMKPTLTPNFLIARDYLKELGHIRKYFSAYCQYSSRYDRYKAGELPNAFRKDLANGAIMDIGVYTIYPMVVLFGKPHSIKATGVLLPSGVDAEGCAVFNYGDMDATVIFSKVSESVLPTQIQGEQGYITFDRINIIGKTTVTNRKTGEVRDITQPHIGEEYYYEIKEFIDLIESGKQESSVNSWKNSLIVMEIMDEIRKQIGVLP
ncbi:MAG TPA: Gfo/Idh/MocA family oxidoreductase [Candidatus Avirikenella pullistercoris]|nr:Gfo/Idh/MocA family oxidoreductase [Candidatus Avirikenella pullistercoris]